MSTLRRKILFTKEPKYYLVKLTGDLHRLSTIHFTISGVQHPPNLDMRALLICEVPCSPFKDCFQTRVYCLVLVVVAWLVRSTRSFFLREPATESGHIEGRWACIYPIS